MGGSGLPSVTIVADDMVMSGDNMEQFLCQQIESRIKNGTRSIVYTEAEMQNIFTLYDLKNSGNISKEQCREGKYQNVSSRFMNV